MTANAGSNLSAESNTSGRSGSLSCWGSAASSQLRHLVRRFGKCCRPRRRLNVPRVAQRFAGYWARFDAVIRYLLASSRPTPSARPPIN